MSRDLGQDIPDLEKSFKNVFARENLGLIFRSLLRTPPFNNYWCEWGHDTAHILKEMSHKIPNRNHKPANRSSTIAHCARSGSLVGACLTAGDRIFATGSDSVSKIVCDPVAVFA